MVVEVERIDAGAIGMASEILRGFEAPALPEEVAKAFAKMRVSTAHRNDAAHDERLQAEVYCEAMLQYPRDIALRVLGKRRHWFPTLRELEVEAEEWNETRASLRKALC